MSSMKPIALAALLLKGPAFLKKNGEGKNPEKVKEKIRLIETAQLQT